MESLRAQYKSILSHIQNHDIDEESLRFGICDLYANSISIMDGDGFEIDTDDIVKIFKLAGSCHGLAIELSNWMYGSKDESLFD